MASEMVVTEEQEDQSTPLLQRNSSPSAPHPSVEVRLYRRGAGPVVIFRSDLAGPRRDSLDVRAIQVEHGLRALFAFKPKVSQRGLRIRPVPAGGYSAVSFRDGAVIALDGEPKGSWTKPVTIIAVGLLVPAMMIAAVGRGVPDSLRSSSMVNGLFTPWILVSAAIIFARMRLRPRVS